MKISDTYDHLSGLLMITSKGGLFGDLKDVIRACNLKFGENRPQEIKRSIGDGLSALGWADRVKIKNQNNLTINFVKNKTGACLQLGNVARTYADLLKLAYLWERKTIDCGVILVPDFEGSRLLGANYADFERLTREIELFSGIIRVPMLIIALSN